MILKKYLFSVFYINDMSKYNFVRLSLHIYYKFIRYIYIYLQLQYWSIYNK